MYNDYTFNDMDIYIASADALFEHIIKTSMLAHESNKILEKAITFFKEAVEVKQETFDQVLVGSLLYALARSDWKYLPNEHLCIKPARDKLFHLIDHNFSGMSEIDRIFYVGKHALIEKTIPFDGIFSPYDNIQKTITERLPFMIKGYFATYDIPKSGSGIGSHGLFHHQEHPVADILNIYTCNVL